MITSRKQYGYIYVYDIELVKLFQKRKNVRVLLSDKNVKQAIYLIGNYYYFVILFLFSVTKRDESNVSKHVAVNSQKNKTILFSKNADLNNLHLLMTKCHEIKRSD